MKNKYLSGMVFAMLCFYALPSLGVMLDIRGGILHGAKEVQVGTDLYDVSFQDGTCIGLYGGCDEQSDLPFDFLNTPALVSVASLALIEQVFLDSPLGAFDSNPALTNGCFAAGGCQISTPVRVPAQLQPGNGLGVSFAFNHRRIINSQAGGFDHIGQGSGSRFFDSTISDPRNDSHVYALWSKTTTPPTPMPEPSILALLAIGLIAIWLCRQSRRMEDHRLCPA